MSVRYNIAKSILRMLGFKKIFQLPVDKLIEKAEHFNKNRHFKIPKNHKYIYGDIPIMEGEISLFIYPKRTEKVKKSNFIFVWRWNDYWPR